MKKSDKDKLLRLIIREELQHTINFGGEDTGQLPAFPVLKAKILERISELMELEKINANFGEVGRLGMGHRDIEDNASDYQDLFLKVEKILPDLDSEDAVLSWLDSNIT